MGHLATGSSLDLVDRLIVLLVSRWRELCSATIVVLGLATTFTSTGMFALLLRVLLVGVRLFLRNLFLTLINLLDMIIILLRLLLLFRRNFQLSWAKGAILTSGDFDIVRSWSSTL